MMTIRTVPIDLRTPGTSFVAREPELARLGTALAAAADGSPSSLLIAGEAGVGKTRLVHEFAKRVGGNAQVLLGSCIQLRGASLPYGPIVDALRPLVRELDSSELDELLGPNLGDLTRLLPAETPQPPRRPAEPAGEFAQARLFELMLQFLDRLAQQRPVVMIVEDVHWADTSTLDLLMFLVRMVRQERLLFVTTYRSDELHPQHPLRTTMAELKRSRHVELVELARFDRAELTALLGGILGRPPSPDVVHRIFARSDGNPFLAEELLVAEGSQPGLELPPRLQDLLLARISALAPDTRHALRVAATMGRPAEHHLLAAASQLPEARLLTAVREAVDSQLVLTKRDAYEFRHVLLQEAVYGELLPGERRRLHAAVARALTEDPHAGTRPETAAELSHHWHAARHYPQALKASISAARAAADVYGFTEAHLQYERALTLWDQVPYAHEHTDLALRDLRLEAAEAAGWAGVADRAVALIREALADLDARIEPTRAGVLRARLAEWLWDAGDTKAALAAYEEASRLVAPEPPSAGKARVLAGYGTELMRQGQYSGSRVLCEEAIAVARAAGARVEEARALNTLGCDLSGLGDPEAGVVALRRALAMSEETNSFDQIQRAYLNLSVVLGGDAGRPHEALQLTRRGLDRMRQLGLELAIPANVLRSDLAWALWSLGRWQEAEELVGEVLTRELPARFALHSQLLQGRLHLGRGRFDLAQEQGQAASRMAEQLIDPPSHSALQAYLAHLAISQGDYHMARSAVARALQHLADSEEHGFAIAICHVGLRAEADAAERAHDRGANSSEIADIHATGQQLLTHVRQSLMRVGTNLSDVTAYAATCEAEF